MSARYRRYTKRSESLDPLYNLVTDIIIDAILIVRGQSKSDEESKAKAICWLRSETCRRWAEAVGVDIQVAMNHKNSMIKWEVE